MTISPIQILSDRIKHEKGAKNALEKQLEHLSSSCKLALEHLENLEKAKEILQIVAKQTQNNLQYHISGLVTTAQASIFPDPYEFISEFVMRRDKTECDFYLAKGQEKFSPFSSCGGGVIDVASFALRLVAWSLKRTAPVIILDEPFRFLSADLQPKASQMLKTLSSRLGLQIIMVSHLPEIIDSADRVINIEKGVVKYV